MRDIHLIQGTGLCTPPHRDPAWIASNMPFTHGNNAYKGIFIPLSIPSFDYQMTPKISLNTRCSISISENLSINGQTRSSDQLGIWSYNINP